MYLAVPLFQSIGCPAKITGKYYCLIDSERVAQALRELPFIEGFKLSYCQRGIQ